MSTSPYGEGPFALGTYRWGNNPRRAELKGRVCMILAWGRMNTILVQFLDTGERVTTSRKAVW